MRALLFSIIALVATATGASANDLKGIWLDNREWAGIQAYAEFYPCRDGNGTCAQIVGAKVGTLAESQKGHVLIRNLVQQNNGKLKGKMKPPADAAPSLNVTISWLNANTIEYRGCLLIACSSGTMSRVQ